LELERRKQHENKSQIVFLMYKTRFPHLRMVVDKNQEHFENPLVIRNLTVFLKLFYYACEGNDNIKRPRTPMCGVRRGVGLWHRCGSQRPGV
jgi:hypothetical protein